VSYSDLFKHAPEHPFKVGDLVTCACHGGIAIIIDLYDKDDDEVYPSMNMMRIYWVRYPHDGVKERIWVHTISKMRKYTF